MRERIQGYLNRVGLGFFSNRQNIPPGTELSRVTTMATTISQTTTMAEPNYILRIEVKYDPVVWRTLSVPTTITFEKLHFAIQIAFGWANAHLYQFLVL